MEKSRKPTIRMRADLSVQHFLGAAYFARQAHHVEQTLLNDATASGRKMNDAYQEIAHLVSASVMLSVAGLEAFSNEMLYDGNYYFKEIPPQLLSSLCSLIESKPILEKFEMALSIKNLSPLPRGGKMFQNVDALIHLRNGLVHFKPEWEDVASKHKTLSQRLQAKFELSPILSASESIFPRRCMSHGCASWAVDSALSFLVWFQKETKIGRTHFENGAGFQTRSQQP